MPTYHYECEFCHVEFDHMQGIKDDKLRTCKKCFMPMLVRHISGGGGFCMDTQFRDSAGSPIWCPTGGYYDRALQRPFKSAREKREYMKEKKIAMDGSTTTSKDFKKHERSGDFKEKVVRKATQMED